MAKLAALVIAWRILLLVLSLFVTTKMPFNPQVAPTTLPGPMALHSTARWDSAYYVSIATQGYSTSPTQPTVAFFPLFPLLTALVSKLGLSILLSGFVINCVAVFFACYFLFKLAGEFFKDKKLAYRTVLLFLFSPVAYFLAAFYTEALFCALAFGAIWYARQSRWWAASLLAGFATATRSPGAIIVIVLLIEYLDQIHFNWKKIRSNILWLLLAPLGIVAHMMYLKYKTGDPLAFIHITKLYWSYHVFTPNVLQTIYNQGHLIVSLIRDHKPADIQYFFDLILPYAAWLLALIVTIWTFVKKLPWSYRILGIASLLLFCINGNFISDHRYFILFFPIYLFFTSITDDESYGLALGASAASMAVLLAAFANSYWTG